MQSIPCPLFDLIQGQSEKMPDALAILAPGKQPVTYGQLAIHLETIALQLNHLGFRRGDRVAVVLPNGPEMATAFLEVSSVCTCAPLNPTYREDEFTSSMKDLRVKTLITSYGSDHPARNAANKLDLPVLELKPDEKSVGLFSLSSDIRYDDGFSEPVLARIEDTALVLQTSGTTSRPKIVPLTNRNIFSSIQNIAGTYALESSDRCLNMMPLFHIHGLIGALSSSLFAGASVICAPGFVADQVMGWLTDLAPTWYTAVPTIHQAILDQVYRQPEKAKETHLRFIRSCSSSLPPKLGFDLESAFGVPVLEAYGMTEATHQMASNPLPPKVHKFGSVGLPTGSTDISILNEKGNILEYTNILSKNSLGEICIRGENVMGGYEENSVANVAAFLDGWLRTGDRGVIDDDGYLFIQGRMKEIINRGGEKISPREIDEILLAHPAVKQAVAFAVPHPTLGEDVAAAIVLNDSQKISAQELRRYAAANLADFKVPRQIVFVEEIPKGPTGKIQRIGLAEKLKPELEALRIRKSSDAPVLAAPLETEILSIWQEVLGMDHIGIQDDFLALGGDSIQASIILLTVNERYRTDFILGDFFSTPTIAGLAEIIQGKIDSNE